MLQVVVVDDEPLPRKAVVELLREDPDVEVVATCAGGKEAVEAVADHEPELLLLDIRMPEMDGFDALERIRKQSRGPGEMPVVVFVTGHEEHAVRAFEAHALDYVLKPVTGERFREALGRAKREVERRAHSDFGRRVASLLDDRSMPEPPDGPPESGESDLSPGGDEGGGPPGRIVVRKSDRTLLLDPAEVDWIEAADNYVRLHTRDDTHLVRETMKGMERELDPDRFVRIHRSAIVRVARVAALEPRGHGDHDVVLDDGTRLPLSRSRREELEVRLGTTL